MHFEDFLKFLNTKSKELVLEGYYELEARMGVTFRRRYEVSWAEMLSAELAHRANGSALDSRQFLTGNATHRL